MDIKKGIVYDAATQTPLNPQHPPEEDVAYECTRSKPLRRVV